MAHPHTQIIPQRMDHSDSVREAVELAVMSTVSHPNILGVQNYWTDVMVTTGERVPGLEEWLGQQSMGQGEVRQRVGSVVVRVLCA